MLEIENSSIDIQKAAVVVGLSDNDIRSLVNRERLFPGMKQRHGLPLSFTIQRLFSLSAVKALIDLGFSIRAACDAIKMCRVYGNLLEGRESSIAVDHEGRLAAFDGPDVDVSIRIRPWVLAKKMRPGLIEAFGEDAVTEWEAALEQLHGD